MALPSISTPKVKIVNKDLEAWIRLPALEEGEHYTIEYLHDVLRVNQITMELMKHSFRRSSMKKSMNRTYCGKRHTLRVEGQDGFYEYKVNMNLEKKPKILPDGSVDYWSMYSVQSVQKDQVIAIYHPAVKGTDGIGVSENRLPQGLPENREHFAEPQFLDEVRLPYLFFADGWED